MSVKLLTEHHLEFLSLKGCYTGTSESTFVKMPHCWKLHVAAHIFLLVDTEVKLTYRAYITIIKTLSMVV